MRMGAGLPWKMCWVGCGTTAGTAPIPFAYILQERDDQRRLVLSAERHHIHVSDSTDRNELLFDENTLESNQPVLASAHIILTQTGKHLGLHNYAATDEHVLILRALNIICQKHEQKLSSLVDDVNVRIRRVNDVVHRLAGVLQT